MSTTVEEKNDPMELFKEWFDQAQKLNVKEPAAVLLATSTTDGKPSLRTMLMKEYDQRGFCFFTNLTSRKGKELLENPQAAMCFYWDAIDRQIRIEGKVERVTEKEADRYFAARSRGSQLGAWSSKQSLAMESDDELPTRVKAITQQFEGQPVPRPPFWSGFRLVPDCIEFWQRGEHRLHKRILYTKLTNSWKIQRLFP